MASETPGKPFRVELTADAKDDLRELPGRAPQFIKKLATLTTHPERGHPLRQDLKHERSLELTRAGGGYRGVHNVYEHAGVVVVYAIGPHKTVYATVDRRYPSPEPVERAAPS